MRKYDKKALTSDEHIELLVSRGLVIEDCQRVKHYLDVIGYCRLEPYFITYYQDYPQFIQFKKNTTFQNILDIYNFDRKLRLLISDVIERVEIAVRVSISNFMSVKYKPHWFIDSKYFKNKIEHLNFIKEVEKYTHKEKPERRSPECAKYYDDYDSPELPPSWIVAEVMPMGVWSRLYTNLNTKGDKRRIANIFGFKHDEFVTWLHAMTNIRNIVAHHGRIWNKDIPIKVRNLDKYSYSNAVEARRSYVTFVILKAFTDKFMKNSSWTKKLKELLEECPLPISKMGFPNDWQSLEFWS